MNLLCANSMHICSNISGEVKKTFIQCTLTVVKGEFNSPWPLKYSALFPLGQSRVNLWCCKQLIWIKSLNQKSKSSQDLDLKLLKITLVNFTYPVQCPKVPLYPIVLGVAEPWWVCWDFLTFAVGTSSSLYGCNDKFIGSYEKFYVSLSCVALILRWTRHLTRGILTK